MPNRRPEKVWHASGPVVALLVAVLAVTTHPTAQPTGVSWWDPALTGGAAALVAWMTLVAPARRQVVPLIVVALGASAAWSVAAATVLVLSAVIARRTPTDSRSDWSVSDLIGSVSAGMVVGAGLFHLDFPGPFGTSTAVAGLALVPLLRPALGRSSISRPVLAGTITVAVAIVAAGCYAGARTALDLQSAAGAMSGDTTTLSRAELDETSVRLEHASQRLRRWWARPAHLVPVMSQHLRVLEALSSGGADITAAGADAFAGVDLALGAGGASLNMAGLERAVEPLDRSQAAILDTLDAIARHRSAWLAPPARASLNEAVAQLEDEVPRVGLARDVAVHLPSLLAVEGERRYLVLFINPAEAREAGGIVGSFAELAVDDGSLRITDRGRDVDLNWGSDAEPLDPAVFPPRLITSKPEQFVQNWTRSTDFPTVARAVDVLYPSFGRSEIDGVIALDPYGLAALVEWMQTVTVTLDPNAPPETFDGSAMLEFLLVGQYERFGSDRDRSLALATLTDSVFQQFTAAPLDPAALARALAPAVAERRIRMVETVDHDANPLLDRLGLRGEHRADGHDHVAVVHTNLTGNKLDAHIARDVDIDTRVDLASGRTTSTVTIRLHNRATPDMPSYVLGRPERTGLPAGRHRLELSVFANHRLTGVEIDGAPMPVRVESELGLQRASVILELDLGTTTDVVMTWEGPTPTPTTDETYRLSVWAQPLVVPDEISIRVDAVDGDATATWLDTSTTLNGDLSLEAPRRHPR